jgi:uncharacterized MAPEG superfamily protein
MSFAIWMILVAALLPYLTVGLAKARAGGYDNAMPRDWSERLTGWHRRADWAHRNHFEAFPPFAAAVIVAILASVPAARLDLLAGAFVLCRVLYTAAYIANAPSLRSLLWFGGIVCVIALLVSAA